MIFVPAGPSRPIGTGATLRGGSVVIENATVQKIATEPGTVTTLDDTRWQTLASTAAVPAVSTTGDPRPAMQALVSTFFARIQHCSRRSLRRLAAM